MKECGFAAKDAKAFTDMLATQLMALDGVSNYLYNTYKLYKFCRLLLNSPGIWTYYFKRHQKTYTFLNIC